jgi:hypothetical protein
MSKMRGAVRNQEHVALLRKVQPGNDVRSFRAARSKAVRYICASRASLRTRPNDSPEDSNCISGARPFCGSSSAQVVFIALPRRSHSSRFLKIDTYAPHFHGQRFRVDSEEDLDAEVRRWIRTSYAVGEQRHLRA